MLEIGIGSAVLGYLVFQGLLFYYPRKLRAQNLAYGDSLKQKAQEDSIVRKKLELARQERKLSSSIEELETEIKEKMASFESEQTELKEREQQLQNEEQRVQKRQREIDSHRSKAANAKALFDASQVQAGTISIQVKEKLATTSGLELERLKNSITEDVLQKKQIESTRSLRMLADELNTSASRLATRMLARTHARYSPEFVWPKGMNHVEIDNTQVLEVLADPECQLIKDLTELTEGVNLGFVAAQRADQKPVIRLGGGYGIYKEAAKFTLEELLPKTPAAWARVGEVYARHKKQLEGKALQLGKMALVELKLDHMHVEILKMIGALNWRTSYRQNQYYHSVEVAKLAGVLATELGVDASAAKRSGLLHDIGKSIDYRIDGSHAVISGDYADRFGESRLICDTVMSHHADLIVETPLAWVLQAADTLSGARPGARVNLEEGYQDRLSSIQDVVRAFPGVVKIEIMNGAREVHVEVNHKRVPETELQGLSTAIARKIEENVAYPGQIKILVSRRFESVAVA